MAALNFVILDVFTNNQYEGNPLALVHVPAEINISQDRKQAIAREFNLSETVFLHEQTAADVEAHEARIDIFTPLAEIPFAGHPTVGTANYLVHHTQGNTINTLVAKAGRLPFQADAGGVKLSVAHHVHIHSQPFAGTEFEHHPVVSIVNGMTFILAKMPDLESLGEPTANLIGTANTYKAKEKLDEGWQNGPVITYYYVDLGVKDGKRQLRTRSLGSREDPATGSAASALCSFLALNSQQSDPLVQGFHITQGVEFGRESHINLQVTLESSRSKIQEVLLGGTCVITMEGKAYVDSKPSG